jgi:hypothetical protein
LKSLRKASVDESEMGCFCRHKASADELKFIAFVDTNVLMILKFAKEIKINSSTAI